MKQIVISPIIIICIIQLMYVQHTEAQVSPSMEIITKQPWVKTHDQMGVVQLEFKKDLTYIVTLKSNNDTIKGTYSLKGDLLTFENESNCKTKGVYTISVTKEVITFVLKTDQCMGRNEISPGIWKALK